MQLLCWQEWKLNLRTFISVIARLMNGTDHPSLSAAFTLTAKSSRNFTIWWCPAQTALWRGVMPSSLGMLGFSTFNGKITRESQSCLCFCAIKKASVLVSAFSLFNLQVKVRVKVLKSGELNSFSSVSELLSRSVLHPRGETPSACFRAGREWFLEVLPILSVEQRRPASGWNIGSFVMLLRVCD